MRMCFDKRVLIGLGVVALGVLAVSPRLLGSIAPLLIFAACPLSMLLMMRAMNRQGSSCETASDGRRDAEAPDRGDVGVPTSGVRRDRDAEVRELEEEVNRLKAEMQLRNREPSA